VAKIEGFRIKNYKVLKDISMGKFSYSKDEGESLTNLTVVIGKNGTGKSSLFDAFGFLSDALKEGVETACDMRGRGGFDRLRSKGAYGPIEFFIYYREEANSRPISYELVIDVDEKNRPYVSRERLRQRRKGQKHGQPLSFFYLQNGKGIAWKGDDSGVDIGSDQQLIDIFDEMRSGRKKEEESSEMEPIEFTDSRELGIATLGSLMKHPRIAKFRKFIEGWYLSYFSPDSARSLPNKGPQKHLNTHGDNLANVVQFMEREHNKIFQSILKRIAEKIPGINTIETESTPDGRLLLKFNDRGFTDPFYAQQMSDGTLKMFAYLLLLEDPSPPPFICIEEPENGLYHKLLESLVEEFREHSSRKGGTQIFITTHHPLFVNALKPEEVWSLSKNKDGFSEIRRASDDNLIQNLVEQELPLGNLWYSDYLEEGMQDAF
jgi:predicted ATPase